MPTGDYKSYVIKYQLLLMKRKLLYISPLVALMDDQVSALKQNKVSAEQLTFSYDRY